jgi:hypothetical protein
MRGQRSRRSRSTRIGIALIAAVSLALPLSAIRTAGAMEPAVRMEPAAPMEPAVPMAGGTAVSTAAASSVTLPTGQEITLTGPVGRQNILVDQADLDGPGRTLVTRRTPTQTLVLPAVAEPYLGRFLEPSLFDVTALSTALREDRRLPVRIAYRGSTPTVPGVEITSASGGTATGYLTPSSAVAFGRALTDVWLADSTAGWPHRSSLFTGVTRIGTGAVSPEPARPNYQMYTLGIRTIGVDGSAQPQAHFGLMNVDDGRMYTGFVNAQNGVGQVSVPAGTYSAVGDQFSYDARSDTTTLTVSTVNEFTVTGSGQTLTLDQRTATAEPTVTTPKPAELTAHYLEWNRRDVTTANWISTGYFLDPNAQVLLTPAEEVTVGTVNLIQNWGLSGPGNPPAYSYDLASLRNRITDSPQDVFTEEDLATVRASYYDDGSKAQAALLRYPRYPNLAGGGGAYDTIPRGSTRTEYVGATGRPTWTDSAKLNSASTLDPGIVEGPDRLLPAGSEHKIDWFRGPLAPGVPEQIGSGSCFVCRSGNTLLIALAPVTDSEPTHRGGLYGAQDGTPVARFRFWADGEPIVDQNDVLGGSIQVSAEKAEYRAFLEVDRRLTEAAQSTRTTTELTFGSSAGAGTKLPSNWLCALDNCTVLPVLQAKVGLPTGLTGRMPAGPATVTVTAAQVQGAEPAPITSATLEVRPAGGEWSAIELTAGTDGRYTGVIDGSDSAGADVDLRVSAVDQAGSTFTQTTERAYTVEAS